MANDRMNKPLINLKEVLPPNHFRTVESFKNLKAPSEFPVVIDMKTATKKQLSFSVSWDGILYAYARATDGLLKLAKKATISEISDVSASLNDWDDKFALIFEDKNKNEYSYFVSKADVIDLLENCCRIPQQR